MISRLALRKLAKDERGAAAVEFALVLTPFLIIILGALEFGYVAYVKSMTQGALNNAARLAAVEDPAITAEGDTVEGNRSQITSAILSV